MGSISAVTNHATSEATAETAKIARADKQAAYWPITLMLSSLTPTNFVEQREEYRRKVQEFSIAAQRAKTAANSLQASLTVRKAVQSAGSAINGTAKPGAKQVSYEISVTQVASQQQNSGISLNANERNGLGGGKYTIGIKNANGTERQLSVVLQGNETNNEMLNKFATVISYSGSGVFASVQRDTDGEVNLRLQAQRTGTAQAFTVRDIRGNAVDALRLAEVKQVPANAEFTLNGIAYMADSNQVTFDGGNVTLNLNALTVDASGAPQNVKATVGNDVAGAIAAAKTMVESYNSLRGLLRNAALTDQGTVLAADLSGIAKRSDASALKNLGIVQDPLEGEELFLDAQVLERAIRKDIGAVRQTVGSERGVAFQLAQWGTRALDSSAGQYLKAPNDVSMRGYDNRAQPVDMSVWLGRTKSGWQGWFMDMAV